MLSRDAAWRSVYLTLDIEAVIGHSFLSVKAADRVRVGLTLDGGPIDHDAVLASLEGLGRGIFFLKRHPFGVDGDDGILHLAFAGASTMVIGDDGALTLPLYTERARLLVAARISTIPADRPVPTDLTLESLRERASAPIVVDRLDD